MARKPATWQNQQAISIYREGFMRMVVLNDDLSRNDIRVALHLLTYLDSKTYKSISKTIIAEDLNIKKKHVKESLENLEFQGIIMSGMSDSAMNGYKIIF